MKKRKNIKPTVGLRLMALRIMRSQGIMNTRWWREWLQEPYNMECALPEANRIDAAIRRSVRHAVAKAVREDRLLRVKKNST